MLWATQDLRYWEKRAYVPTDDPESAFPDTRSLQLRTHAVTPDRSARSGDVALQTVPFHQAIERRAIDAGPARGLRQIAAGVGDHASQKLAVELRQQTIARVV